MRSIIKSERIRQVEAALAPTTGRHARGPVDAHEKSVRLLEEGGRTHAVEVTCSCGEVTLLELRYDETANTPVAEPEPAPLPHTDQAPEPDDDVVASAQETLGDDA